MPESLSRLYSGKMENKIIFNNKIFKQIKKYKEYYISKDGDLYSNYRKRLRKTNISKNGYVTIKLYSNNKIINTSIHRLIGFTWLCNPNKYKEINHIDGNKLNNCVENLEWTTRSNNNKHKFKILGYKSSAFGKFGKDNPSSKKVKQFDLENNLIKIWDSIKDAERYYGRMHISCVCLGKRKSCGGFKWEFLTN